VVLLLGLNGPRISEPLGADVTDLDTERGHRVLRITRKGGKKSIVPLAPRTAEAVESYVGDRATGPLSLRQPVPAGIGPRPGEPFGVSLERRCPTRPTACGCRKSHPNC
jgi:integrase